MEATAGSRKYSPLPDDHPVIQEGKKCPGCDEVFEAGAITTLVTIGPGDDPAERARARRGMAYNAVAVIAHWACVTGEES